MGIKEKMVMLMGGAAGHSITHRRQALVHGRSRTTEKQRERETQKGRSNRFSESLRKERE